MSLSRRKFLSLSGAAMASAAAGRITQACGPVPDPADLASGINAFAADVYGRLRVNPGNLFFSPASLSTALTMTAGGARGNTLAEMNAVLHLPENPHFLFNRFLGRVFAHGQDIKRPYELTAANSVWAHAGYPWHEDFKTLIRKNYLAAVVDTDFGKPEDARAAINKWVEKETREKIKELIPGGVITPLTRMVLANAVYFKGDWATQFKEKDTKDAPFHLDGGEKVPVPMMHQSGDFDYGEVEYDQESRAGDSMQVLALPYAGNDLSMVLMLPKRRNLAALEGKLTAANLAAWTKGLHKQTVRVRMPRFKLEPKESLRLNEPLQALGMKDAFDDKKADFRGMHTGKDVLYITAVMHKAFVDVNEKGTEAAAATGVVVGLRGAARETEFRADKPFLFLIRENKTGAVLFLGRVSNPKA
jgi:serpin B